MESLYAQKDIFPYVHKFLGIDFNPDNHCGFDDPSKVSPDLKTVEIPGHPDVRYEVVDYAGSEWLVHGTNNLLYLIEAYMGKLRGEDAPDPDESLSAFMYRFALDKSSDMQAVLDRVAQKHPDLFACLSLIYEKRKQELAVAAYLRDHSKFDSRPAGSPTPDDEERKRRKIVLSYTLEAVLTEAKTANVDAVAWCQ